LGRLDERVPVPNRGNVLELRLQDAAQLLGNRPVIVGPQQPYTLPFPAPRGGQGYRRMIRLVLIDPVSGL
jgi:hypothetical protein